MALPELLANSTVPGTLTPLGTLTAAITTTAALSMSTSAAAPAALLAVTGQFRIVVDSEIMLVAASATGASPWTVITRGAEGSTAATHLSGVAIYHYLTVAALQAAAAAVNPTQMMVSDASYTVLAADQVITLTSLSATRTMTLPSTGLTTGQTLTVVDQTGLADRFPVVLVGTVNGGPAAVLKDAWGKIMLTWTGTQWRTEGWAASAPPLPAITGITYYVDQVAGVDTNNGTSTATAWKTVAKVHGSSFSPGDAVLFKGGNSWNEELVFYGGFTGTATAPIIIGSYGTGQPTIQQGVYFDTATYVIFDNINFPAPVQAGGSGANVNHITFQRCTISEVGNTTGSDTGLTVNGSDWQIVGNYIHDMPAHAMVIGSVVDGTSGGYIIARNLMVRIGRNPALGYNAHCLYGDAHDVVLADNVCAAFYTSSAVSQRYRNWAVERNHFASGGDASGGALDFFEYDTIPGKSYWRNNRFAGMSSGAAMFVASTEGSNTQVLESFTISENDLTSLMNGATPWNLQNTTGTMEQWGNTIGGDQGYSGTQGDDYVNQIPGRVLEAKAAPTYGTTVTPDARLGTWQTITATNTTAFTVAAPLGPPGATRTADMVIEVLNSSGGTMGAITWNAVFLFATGAWANPANTKHRFAQFKWNGANWVCTRLASADY